MCVQGTPAGREKLGFADAVKRSFGWLERMGFGLSAQADTLVRYQSGAVEVTVYHGRSSYEIGVEAGPRNRDVRFSLAELIEIADPQVAETYRIPSATTPEAVARFAEEQSERLQRYGGPIFRGDPSVWDRLASARHAWAEAYALDAARSRAIAAAREALRRRAYPEVVSLLQPFEGQLPRVQEQMLALARRRAGGKPPGTR